MRDLFLVLCFALMIVGAIMLIGATFITGQLLYAGIGIGIIFQCILIEMFIEMAKNVRAVREHLDLLMAMKKKEVIDKR